jgi:predicted PolB exonuclease-like 3'-5' exonuclease
MYLILDIETIPNQGATPPEMPSDFVKYGNTKDTAKREIIEQEARIEWANGLTKKMSLSGELCQIISCGFMLIDDDYKQIESDVLFDENDDKEILKEINMLLKTPHNIPVGWNSKGFDLPVLWKRSILQGVPYPITRYLDTIKKYDTRDSIDLMHVWNNFEMGKLTACCNALGIASKTGLDGSMIYEAYKAGRFEEIKEYNMQDVTACFSIMSRIGIGKRIEAETLPNIF